MRAQIIDKFGKALTRCFKNFKENPFAFYYEEDIRVNLMNELIINLEGIYYLPSEKLKEYEDIKTHKLLPLKAEYPHIKDRIGRFDIAFTEEEGESIYHLPVSIAIELKLGLDQSGSLKKDVNSLLEYKEQSKTKHFSGIAIYFHQKTLIEEEARGWFKDSFIRFEKTTEDTTTITDDAVNIFLVSKNLTLFQKINQRVTTK